MNKFSIIMCVFISMIFGKINAQSTNQNFIALKQALNTINPELDLVNKLIFISIWKSTDSESREINKEAYRVYKIYEKAKLRNAEKGVVFLSLNLDTDSQIRSIAVGRDGIDESVVYSDAQLITLLQSQFNLSGTQSTIVLDKTGNIDYSNLLKDQIFSSLRNLTIR